MSQPDREHTLYLIDVSSFIFRAFFAIRQLNNKKGEPTNAVYGVATMLARLVEEANPKHVGVICDSKEPSFREEIYPEYKANRSEPPDDLIPQFARIDELVAAMGFYSVREPGVEADDLIATLTHKWCNESPKNKVVIVTGDKDLMQLVNDRVVVWDTMKEKTFRPDDVVEKFGVGPEKIRDYLALIGDSSDNIPGVPSIGPKTAVQLLTEHGDLQGVLKAAEAGKISGKKGDVLKANREAAELSARLVTLVDDVKVHFDPHQVHYEFKVGDALTKLLKELDFHTLLERWNGKTGVVAPPPSSKTEDAATDDRFRCINTQEDFTALLATLKKKGEFAVDLETTSLNPREAEIVGISIAHDLKFGVYIPVGHRADSTPQLDRDWVLEQLKPLIENPKIKKIGQNLKYDWSVLIAHGFKPDGIGADTMVASYVVDPSGRHNMDFLALKYLDYKTLTFEEICGKGKDQIGFDQVTVAVGTRYSAEDAWVTLNLWDKLRHILDQEKLMPVFAQVDLPLVSILTSIECEGVHIDSKWLNELSKKFEKELAAIQEQVDKYSKEPINLNSPKQIGQLLFEELKLPTQSKTKTGFSTDASVLETLAPLHPVPRLLLEFREISKLKGTYVDPLPLMVDKKTSKIHAGFHQTVAATGRLSSSDPNLQNIPIRSERGQLIRRAFIPSPGNVLLSADYSQIELRILAHMSGDPDLSESFRKDEDVHRRTASEIFSVAPDAVTDEQRNVAKAINFGLMYGKTAFGLAQELGIPRREAQDVIDRYFKRYSAVKKFLDQLIADAREKGLTTTLMGRKRMLPEIHSKNPAIRNNAERMAMNTPIQGTAADLMKIAMIDLDHELTKGDYKSRMIIQVHDEIVLDCPESEAETVKKLVVRVMESAMKLDVPLKANAATGKNWAEL